MAEGRKFDSGKNRLDLIEPDFLEALGWVLTHGAKMHGDRNWQMVDRERFQAALMRHYVDREKGELYANDTCMLHTAHMAANVMFLLYKDIKSGACSGRCLCEICNTAEATHKRVDTSQVEGILFLAHDEPNFDGFTSPSVEERCIHCGSTSVGHAWAVPGPKCYDCGKDQ